MTKRDQGPYFCILCGALLGKEVWLGETPNYVICSAHADREIIQSGGLGFVGVSGGIEFSIGLVSERIRGLSVRSVRQIRDPRTLCMLLEDGSVVVVFQHWSGPVVLQYLPKDIVFVGAFDQLSEIVPVSNCDDDIKAVLDLIAGGLTLSGISRGALDIGDPSYDKLLVLASDGSTLEAAPFGAGYVSDEYENGFSLTWRRRN